MENKKFRFVIFIFVLIYSDTNWLRLLTQEVLVAIYLVSNAGMNTFAGYSSEWEK
jgi:hypothetical protein